MEKTAVPCRRCRLVARAALQLRRRALHAAAATRYAASDAGEERGGNAVEIDPWRRCPSCGYAGPVCFDEENTETPAWTPDQTPTETPGDGEDLLVLCPNCKHEYDPRAAE